MAIDLNELARNSLTAAYREQVSVLFKTLVANLIQADVGTGVSADEAGASFMRGLHAAQEAYVKAEKLIP